MEAEQIEKVRVIRGAFREAVAAAIEGTNIKGPHSLAERLWDALAARGDVLWIGYAPDHMEPEDPGINPADEPQDSIQQRLASELPELLAMFRARAVPLPRMDGRGCCSRCGATVQEPDAHAKWHESLTIGFDALAAMMVLTRTDSA